MSSIAPVNLTMGLLGSYILTGLLPWRTSCFVLGVFSITYLLLLLTIPESPYWFLLKNKREEAEKALRRLRGPDFNFDQEIGAMEKKLNDVGTNISYKELFKTRSFRPLLIGLFAQTLQQFSGGNIIMVYTSSVLFQAKSSINPYMATIYTGIFQVTGAIISLFVIDKVGRKILLSSSIIFCSVFITLLGAYFYLLETDSEWSRSIPFWLMSAFVFSYCLGCRSIPWIIGSEIFNTSIRSRANAVTLVYNRTLSIILIQVRILLRV